jgi:hypothetical protein
MHINNSLKRRGENMSAPETSVTAKDVLKIFKDVPSKGQLMKLCEAKVIKPYRDARGTGSNRLFDRYNLFEIGIWRELHLSGFGNETIQHVLESLRTASGNQDLMNVSESQRTASEDQDLYLMQEPQEPLKRSYHSTAHPNEKKFLAFWPARKAEAKATNRPPWSWKLLDQDELATQFKNIWTFNPKEKNSEQPGATPSSMHVLDLRKIFAQIDRYLEDSDLP